MGTSEDDYPDRAATDDSVPPSPSDPFDDEPSPAMVEMLKKRALAPECECIPWDAMVEEYERRYGPPQEGTT